MTCNFIISITVYIIKYNIDDTLSRNQACILGGVTKLPASIPGALSCLIDGNIKHWIPTAVTVKQLAGTNID